MLLVICLASFIAVWQSCRLISSWLYRLCLALCSNFSIIANLSKIVYAIVRHEYDSSLFLVVLAWGAASIKRRYSCMQAATTRIRRS
nr:MAG TPA: hypothetical protein [Caudoviricetes sp.]